MRTRCIPFVLILTLALCAVLAGRASSPSAEEFTVNGLKVILKTNPANGIVAAHLYLRGGVLNISEATQGIEPLIFNSALKGTKNFSKEALNNVLDKTGAVINSSSTRDMTVLSLRCLQRDLGAVWKVFADVAMNPAFEPQEVDLVRKQLLLGIRQRKDNPDSYLNELADEMFFKNHPYQLDPGGTESSMQAVTVEQMRKHLADNLVTSKLLLVVVGNVGKDDLMKKVQETFGRLPMGEYKFAPPQAISHTASSLKVAERALPTNYIIGFFSAPKMGDPDYYAAAVAMDILRFRVFEEVRTKRNLSYAPSAYMDNLLANRAAIYVTAVSPDTTVKVMLAELKKLQTDPVSAKDLKDRVALFLTSYYLRNETNDAQARFLASHELAGPGWKNADGFVGGIRKVTADDVRRVADKYFRHIQFAVVGNPKLINQDTFTSM